MEIKKNYLIFYVFYISEALDVLRHLQTKLFTAIKEKCDIWLDEKRERV